MPNSLVQIQKEALEEVRHGLSHDVLACNTRALQFLELIDAQSDEDKLQKFEEFLPYLQSTLKEAQVKGESINTILRLKLDPLPNTTISPTDTLNTVIDAVKLKFPQEHIDIEGKCDSDTFYIKEDQLSFILNELVENAIIHNPNSERMSICIEIKKEHNNTVIRVSDSGKGFEGDDEGRLFKLFSKSTPIKKDDTHFGIGLSLIKFIAAEYGGTVSVEKQNDRNVVQVTLPISS
jgi:signal transduction histidine kinase